MSKIIVKAKAERGLRRGGIQFTREGVELDLDTLTKEQMEAIASEPNLFTVAIEEGGEPPPAPGKKAPKDAAK